MPGVPIDDINTLLAKSVVLTKLLAQSIGDNQTIANKAIDELIDTLPETIAVGQRVQNFMEQEDALDGVSVPELELVIKTNHIMQALIGNIHDARIILLNRGIL